MKNLYKLLILSLVISFTGCGEQENILFDASNPANTFAQFSGSEATLAVQPTGVSTTPIEVLITTSSNEDRTVSVVIEDSSTATPDQYSISDLVIPAGEFVATGTLTGNYSALPETGSVTVVFSITTVGGNTVTLDNETYSVTLERFCPLVIEDFYGTYTSFQSTSGFDSLGAGPNVTASAGPAENTLLLTDVYGSGRTAVIELDYSDIKNPKVIHRSIEFAAVFQTFDSTGPLGTFAFASQESLNTFNTCTKKITLQFYRAQINGTGAYNPPYSMELTKQ